MTKSTFILWNLNIILESLPLSSSGHLRLLARLLARQRRTLLPIDTATEHLMHIPNGILIGVFLAYFGSGYVFPWSLSKIYPYILAILITNGLTGSVYLILKTWLERFPLAGGFLLSGLTLLSLSFAPTGSLKTISILHALLIGVAQSLALIPGISRMALTTTMGIWLGIDPFLSFIYSLACEFVLICIAVAAALQKQGTYFLKGLSLMEWCIVTASTLVSYAALTMSGYGFVNGTVIPVGWYLIVVSVYTELSRVVA